MKCIGFEINTFILSKHDLQCLTSSKIDLSAQDLK